MPTDMTHADLLSARETCQILGISQATLYAYVSRGLLESRPGPTIAAAFTHGTTWSGWRSASRPDAVLRVAPRKAWIAACRYWRRRSR